MTPCPHPKRNGKHNVYVGRDRLYCKSCGEETLYRSLGQFEALRAAAQALVDKLERCGSIGVLAETASERGALEAALKAVGS